MREIGGGGTLSTTYGKTTYLNSLSDTTYSGPSFGSSGNGQGFQKTGPGTFTITGGSMYVGSQGAAYQAFFWRGGMTFGGTLGALTKTYQTGVTTLYNAVITLDESSADIDRWSDTHGLTVATGRGTLRYLGQESASRAETLGPLNFAVNTLSADRGAALEVQVQPGNGGSATLTFASLTQPQLDNWVNEAAFNFLALAGTLGTDAKVLFTTAPTRIQNGVLNSCYANGTDFAAYDGTDGVKVFAAYTNTVDINTPAATDTVLINAGTTTLTLSGAKQYNAMRIDGARALNLAAYRLTLGTSATSSSLAAMILKTGSGTAEITASGGEIGVAYDAANVPTHYNIRVHEGTLRISAPLDGNINGRLQLLKSGPGLLWLTPNGTWDTGASSYSGLSVAEGAIRLNPSDTDFGKLPFVLMGGVFELTDGMTWAPTFGGGDYNLRWLGDGGFAAYGSDATFSPAITCGGANALPDGAAMLLNSTTADSKITLSGGLNLGTDTAKFYLREIQVADNTGSAGDQAVISGQITGAYTYPLVKTGPGELVLSNASNTYEGRTYVKEGKLTIAGDLANTIVEVMNTATVKVAAAAAARQTAGLELGAATTFELDRGAGQAGRLDVNGAVKLNGAKLSVVGSGAVPSLFTLIDNDGAADPVVGTFAGMGEGAVTNINGTDYTISYVGNDGNDVVLDGQVVVLGAPEVNSSNATDVAFFSARMNGYLVSTGGTETTVYVAWDTNGTRTVDDPLSAWMTNRSFAPMTAEGIPLSTNITGLADNTTYYYNFFATNDADGVWGSYIRTFTTSNASPTIVNGIADIALDGATLNGMLTSTGIASTTVWVAWDTNTARTASDPLSAWMTNAPLPAITSVPTNLSYIANPLLRGVDYVFTFFASNTHATVPAAPVAAFTPGVWRWDFAAAPLNGATRTWETAASWVGATYPNQTGATAIISGNIDGNNTITLGAATTVGAITAEDTERVLNKGTLIITGLIIDNGLEDAIIQAGPLEGGDNGKHFFNFVLKSYTYATFAGIRPSGWVSPTGAGMAASGSVRWEGTHNFGPLTLLDGIGWQFLVGDGMLGDVIVNSGVAMHTTYSGAYGPDTDLIVRAGGTGKVGTDTIAGLGGAGTVQLNAGGSVVTLRARLVPGDDGIGTLTLTGASGNIDLNGTAQIEISGAATFDKVNLSNQVAIDLAGATIAVTLLDGYEPERDSTYAVIVNGTAYTGTPRMADGAWVYDGNGVIRYQGILGTVILLR